jgi:hypothetical protein
MLYGRRKSDRRSVIKASGVTAIGISASLLAATGCGSSGHSIAAKTQSVPGNSLTSTTRIVSQSLATALSSAAALPPTSPTYGPGEIVVTISMYEQFTEIGGGGCEGHGPFEGLSSNNIAYLIGTTNRNALTGVFATGFTRTQTVCWDGHNKACDVTARFNLAGDPDPAGYDIQIGNPSQWKAGPYQPDPGPYGTIRLRACPGPTC